MFMLQSLPLIWFIIVFFYGNFFVDCASEPDGDMATCHMVDSQTNTTWRLVFEDQFESSNVTDNWDIQNEVDECLGNGLRPVTNCHIPRNVYQSTGYLVLVSKYETYLGFNFTGATLRTRQFFSYGRLEVRASQPIGDNIRTRIVSLNTSEVLRHEDGLVNVASIIMDGKLYRDVIAEESRDFYDQADLSLSDLTESLDLHEFHLYGAEWDDEGVVFFLDDAYSKKIYFNSTATGIKRPHHIQLQMGVGGQDYERPESLDRFEDLNWQCPAFVIDYVRVYERITWPFASTLPNLTLCPTLVPSNETEQILEGICQVALQENQVPIWLKIRKHWKLILFSSLGLSLSLFILYLVYLVFKMRRKIASDPFASLSSPNDDNLYEAYIYNEPLTADVAENAESTKNAYLKLYEDRSYTKLYDINPHNVYIPITGSLWEIAEKNQQTNDDDNQYYDATRRNRYVTMKKARSEGQIVLADGHDEQSKYLAVRRKVDVTEKDNAEVEPDC